MTDNMIKNLLFDLGGVIMDIKRLNCVKSFERLGMANADDFFGEYTQNGPFLMLEEGAITESQFRDEIRKIIGSAISDEEIDHAFNDFLVGIPMHRLKSLRKLKSQYNIYLLSNTNSIMWNSRIAEEFRKEGDDVNFYFQGIVTSFETKCLKPNAKIFETAISKFGIIPDETLFFDDSQRNIDTAKALGFNVALVKQGEEFINMI